MQLTCLLKIPHLSFLLSHRVQLISFAGAVRRQKLSNGGFRISANELIHQATVLEENTVRDALNLKLQGRLGVFFRIDFGEQEASLIFGSQLFEQRAERAAGAAPRSPKVDEYRDGF